MIPYNQFGETTFPVRRSTTNNLSKQQLYLRQQVVQREEMRLQMEIEMRRDAETKFRQSLQEEMERQRKLFEAEQKERLEEELKRIMEEGERRRQEERERFIKQKQEREKKELQERLKREAEEKERLRIEAEDQARKEAEEQQRLQEEAEERQKREEEYQEQQRIKALKRAQKLAETMERNAMEEEEKYMRDFLKFEKITKKQAMRKAEANERKLMAQEEELIRSLVKKHRLAEEEKQRKMRKAEAMERYRMEMEERYMRQFIIDEKKDIEERRRKIVAVQLHINKGENSFNQRVMPLTITNSTIIEDTLIETSSEEEIDDGEAEDEDDIVEAEEEEIIEEEEEDEVVDEELQKIIDMASGRLPKDVSIRMLKEFAKYSAQFLSVVSYLKDYDSQNEFYGLFYQCLRGDINDDALIELEMEKRSDQGSVRQETDTDDEQRLIELQREKYWKKFRGANPTVAMYEFVYKAKEVLSQFGTYEEFHNKVGESIKFSRQKLKLLNSYFDHYLMIHRGKRPKQYTLPYLTETLENPTVVQNVYEEDTDDQSNLLSLELEFTKIVPDTFNLNENDFVVNNEVQLKDLVQKLSEVNIPVPKTQIVIEMSRVAPEIKISREDLTESQFRKLIKIQRKVKNFLQLKRLQKHVDLNELKHYLVQQYNLTWVKRTPKSGSEESHEDDESSGIEDDGLDPEERERIMRQKHDFWLGTIMAKFPIYFLDIYRKKVSVEKFDQKLCANCSLPLFHLGPKRGKQRVFYSDYLGFFCKTCLPELNSDFLEFMKQLKESYYKCDNFPKFDSDDRRKSFALMIDKARPKNIKGWCYKNQNKKIRRQLFPHKWQWRMNEKRNVLQTHEFLTERGKRTHLIAELQKMYGAAYAKKIENGLETIQDGIFFGKVMNDMEMKVLNQKINLEAQKRRLYDANVLRFHHVRNVGISVNKFIFHDENHLKEELKKTHVTLRIDAGKSVKTFKLPRDEVLRGVQNKPFVKPFIPVAYVKSTQMFGILSETELVGAIKIEPMADAQEVFLFPVSDVYVAQNEKIRICKQQFVLAFFIAAQSNQNLEQREKNRGMLQIFEITANQETNFCGVKGGLIIREFDDDALEEIEVLNQKLLLNVNVFGEQQFHQNILPNGSIDGFKVFDYISNRLLVLKRSNPFEFPFQNEVTFCRYQKYYKYRKPYKNDRVQILLVEAQVTNKAKDNLHHYQQMMVLNNAIRVLLNHVPFDQVENDKYEFIANDEHALELFVKDNSWIQPLGALGGRSISSYLLMSDRFEEEFEPMVLTSKAKDTLLDKFLKENPKLFKTQEMKDYFKVLIQNKDEMSTDLSYRCPIHDALDQNNLFPIRETIKSFIKLAASAKNSSVVPREILMGIMHRVFQDNQYNLQKDYIDFLLDNQEDKVSISKFAVSFTDTKFEARQDFQYHVNYLSDCTQIDPERFIKNTYKIHDPYEANGTDSEREEEQVPQSERQPEDDSIDEKPTQQAPLLKKKKAKSENPPEMEGGGGKEEEEEAHDKPFEVKHYFVDFRHVFLQAKLQLILGKPLYQKRQEKDEHFLLQENNLMWQMFYETSGFTTTTHKANIISIIYQFYSEHVVKMSSLRIISDSLFVKTKEVIKLLALVYILMFVLPFLVQLNIDDGLGNILCMILMLIMQLFLLFLEYLNLQNKTWAIYKNDKMNFFELAQSFIFMVYLGIRIASKDKFVLPHRIALDLKILGCAKLEENAEESGARLLKPSGKGVVTEDPGLSNQLCSQNIPVEIWVVANSLLLLLIVLKILYFMRVSASLAKLVKLSGQVFSDVIGFLCFLFFWMITFLLLFLIAGANYELIEPEKGKEGDLPVLTGYKGLMYEAGMFLQVFRNSYGDIQIPMYSFWLNNPDILASSQTTFIVWIWILFILHEFFIMIALFNFLIAIITKSYEDIMKAEQVETTASRVYINQEASVIFDTIDIFRRKKQEPCQIFHIIADKETYEKDQNSEFEDVVKMVKVAVKNENRETVKALNERLDEMDQRMQTNQSEIMKMLEKMSVNQAFSSQQIS